MPIPQNPPGWRYTPRQIEILREILNQPAPHGQHMVDLGPELPQVQRPAGFRDDPRLYGVGPDTGAILQFLMAIAPELRGRIQSVTERDIPPEENALGFVDHIGGSQITVTPRQPPWMMNHTLAHEANHIVGGYHGDPSMNQLLEMFHLGGR